MRLLWSHSAGGRDRSQSSELPTIFNIFTGALGYLSGGEGGWGADKIGEGD